MFPNKHILVVEDDSDHFALIEDGLQRAQIVNRLTHVRSAEEAIAYLKGEGDWGKRELHPLPCLVLLDLKLPLTSGFTVLEWVRAQPTLRALPVVVLTGSGASADLDKAYALGANSYLVKPFTPEDFRALVKSINSYWVLLAEKPRLSPNPSGS